MTPRACCVLALLLLLEPASLKDPTITWTYHKIGESMRGAEDWGGECQAQGEQQSPIELNIKEALPGLEKLNFTCNDVEGGAFTVANNQMTVKVTPRDAGACSLMIAETKYLLDSIHFHSKSEHTLDGKKLDLEAHFVHKSGDKLAVVGVLFQVGEGEAGSADPFLASVFGSDIPRLPIPNIEDLPSYYTKQTPFSVNEVTGSGTLKLSGVVGDTDGYLRYEGSLTTPPCKVLSGPVLWTVMTSVKPMSQEQLDAFRKALGFGKLVTTTARPLQLTVLGTVLRVYTGPPQPPAPTLAAHTKSLDSGPFTHFGTFAGLAILALLFYVSRRPPAPREKETVE